MFEQIWSENEWEVSFNVEIILEAAAWTASLMGKYIPNN